MRVALYNITIFLINWNTSFIPTGVIVRPTILVPLTNISAEEGRTVNLECLVAAITMSGWTLFTWRKNKDVINSNPHKYNISKEINPYGDNKNSIKFILTIYNISKEDEANYTLVVYYDTYVLEQNGITGKFLSQTTGSLQLVDIDNKGSCISMFVYHPCILCRFRRQKISANYYNSNNCSFTSDSTHYNSIVCKKTFQWKKCSW